jgi:hypothetical protein
VSFGSSGDKPVPGDFDGDSKTDFVVYRPSTGDWYLNRSKLGFTAVRFGISEDMPLQADFDGDRRSDIALFRPSTKTWYYVKSSNASVAGAAFGNAGERPVPSIFVDP